MKSLVIIAVSLFLCGCTSERVRRFDRDMQQHYEAQCDKYYVTYDTGDIESAKQAMQDVISFSLAERDKAKYYRRFNLMIAFAEARLAVIAEHEGHEQQARSLFAIASHYMALQKAMLREHLREFPHTQFAEADTNSVVMPTPDQWRKTIAKLDAVNHVRWESLRWNADPQRRTP